MQQLKETFQIFSIPEIAYNELAEVQPSASDTQAAWSKANHYFYSCLARIVNLRLQAVSASKDLSRTEVPVAYCLQLLIL
jgi:hypothetical protein